MAVTKIKPVKGGLSKAIDYIQNPAKTDEKLLVSSFGCSFESAYEEFSLTLSKAIDKGNNLAHHLIQSFEPGESAPEQAHEIGRRLADEITKGRHEYVLTTHIDKGHIHNHLIFCAASFMDYKKYISNKKSYHEIRNYSDKLCKEYGLSVVAPEAPDAAVDIFDIDVKPDKPVYDGLRTAKDKDVYRREHESAVLLHEAAARALRKFAGDGGKLPNPAALQAEHVKLNDKKNTLRAEYGKLKQQARGKERGVVL